MNASHPFFHVFAGNVGGTGKSLYASLLADHLLRQGVTVRCFDADPNCRTLEQYTFLPVTRIPWDLRNPSVMEQGVKDVFESPTANEVRIVDFGPAGFGYFCNYLQMSNLVQKTNWLLHYPVWFSRLHGAAQGIEVLHKSLPLALWLTEFPDWTIAREQTLSALKLAPENVMKWIEFPYSGDQLQIRMGTGHSTLTELEAPGKTGVMRALRAQNFRKQLAPLWSQLQ